MKKVILALCIVLGVLGAAPVVQAQEERGGWPTCTELGPWCEVARCESGFNPAAVDPSGTYKGLVQFDQSSWNWVTSDMGRSDLVGVDPRYVHWMDQIQVAHHYAFVGFGGVFQLSPWPVCGQRYNWALHPWSPPVTTTFTLKAERVVAYCLTGADYRGLGGGYGLPSDQWAIAARKVFGNFVAGQNPAEVPKWKQDAVGRWVYERRNWFGDCEQYYGRCYQIGLRQVCYRS